MGLWLLKQWIESDSNIVDQLRQGERLQLDSLNSDGNPVFQKFLDHARDCPDCQRGSAA